MSKVIEITEDNFEEKVLKSDKPVLLDFSAEWCGPCKKLVPIIEELAEEYSDRIVVGHLEVDSAQEIARRYQVMSVPTMMMFNNGEPKQQQIGLVSKNVLAEMIESV